MEFVRLWFIATAGILLLTFQLTLSSHFRGGFTTFSIRNVKGKKVVTFNMQLGWTLASGEAVQDAPRSCTSEPRVFPVGINETNSNKTNLLSIKGNFTGISGNFSSSKNSSKILQPKTITKMVPFCKTLPVNITRYLVWLGKSRPTNFPTKGVSQSSGANGFQIQEAEFNLTATGRPVAYLRYTGGNWVHKYLSWNLSTLVIHGKRSDTGKDNQSPTVSVLPTNGIPQNCGLGKKASTIIINMGDDDGDYVGCGIDKHCGESCHETVKLQKSKRIKVYARSGSCFVEVDGKKGRRGEELLIALRVYDYSRSARGVTIYPKQYIARGRPLSSIPVQFYARIERPQLSLGCDKVPFWKKPTPDHMTEFSTGVHIPFSLRLEFNPLSSKIKAFSELITSGIPDISVPCPKPGNCTAVTATWVPPESDIGRNRTVCFYGRGAAGRTSPPRCYVLHVYAKNCGKATIIGNGSLNYSHHQWWQSITTASCAETKEELFVIPPSAKNRMCAFNETWLGIVPNCTEVKCKPLPQMEHSTLSCPSRSWKRSCSYTCDKGYRKQIDCKRQNQEMEELRCTDWRNPTWADATKLIPREPVPCNLIKCPELSIPTSSLRPTSSAIKKVIAQRAHSKCPIQRDGAEILLKLLDKNAMPFCTGNDWGHSCGIECFYSDERVRRDLNGDQPLWICNKEGHWTGDPSQIHCDDIRCSSDLPPGVHSTVDTCTRAQGPRGDYSIGTQCNYTCDVGHISLISERGYNFSCDPSGQWVGLAPLCVPDDPPQVYWDEPVRADLNCSSKITYQSPFGFTDVKVELPEFITDHHHVPIKTSCNYDASKTYRLWWGEYHVNCTAFDVETSLSSQCSYTIFVTGWKMLIGIVAGTLFAIILTPIFIKMFRQFQRRRPAPEVCDFDDDLDFSDDDDDEYDEGFDDGIHHVQPIYPIQRKLAAA